eukprot:CAMPEP_0204037952 /NCGR_PEP_ID=MMETSP0360-20130528/85324_1 /ASSEMBLY_ACC=CAM_ASM_000342 /TAXON_ID=268821 /ORGANISM="Scrippsiella Hangoei, Strain SHTV-5" /LENGTH=49 /DNA_ID= /DNA_START= /DNA_END= /DNA_ORIENTATION=
MAVPKRRHKLRPARAGTFSQHGGAQENTGAGATLAEHLATHSATLKTSG